MSIQIAPDIYYVGVSERSLKNFESLWPIPMGISYNSYLILDQKITLIDASDLNMHPQQVQKIKEVLGDRPVDYLIINHMEPDHSGAIKSLVEMYPNITLIGNSKTMAMVHGFYDISSNALEITDHDILETGNHRLRFFITPMVHWPETMMTFDETTQTLFSGDAFGSFGALNGAVIDRDMVIEPYWDELRRYYACIVGKYGVPVLNALKKLNDVAISMVCPTHGPVWTKHIQQSINYYSDYAKYKADPGVVIAYGSMYGNTTLMAERIAEELASEGIRRIKMWDTGVTDISYILSDIFNHNALILGCPVYNNNLYPPLKGLMEAIKTRDIKDRYYACFGTYAWGNTPTSQLAAFAEDMKWEMVYPLISQRYSLHEDMYEECRRMARAMADKLKQSRITKRN